MITRSIDTNGDWNFGRGVSDYLSGDAAIAQNIKTRILEFTSDCFFSPDEGIDWFTYLGSKNIIGLNLAIREMILKTDGVTSLVEFSSSVDEDRNLSVSYSVTTVNSTTVTGTVGIV